MVVVGDELILDSDISVEWVALNEAEDNGIRPALLALRDVKLWE